MYYYHCVLDTKWEVVSFGSGVPTRPDQTSNRCGMEEEEEEEEKKNRISHIRSLSFSLFPPPSFLPSFLLPSSASTTNHHRLEEEESGGAKPDQTTVTVKFNTLLNQLII